LSYFKGDQSPKAIPSKKVRPFLLDNPYLPQEVTGYFFNGFVENWQSIQTLMNRYVQGLIRVEKARQKRTVLALHPV